MDNLYNSVKFAFSAWTSKNKVKLFGVTWQGGQGIPSCLNQEKETKLQNIISARGTVKSAKIVGDGEFEDFIAFSIYDSKPVYLIFMACEELVWKQKERKI